MLVRWSLPHISFEVVVNKIRDSADLDMIIMLHISSKALLMSNLSPLSASRTTAAESKVLIWALSYRGISQYYTTERRKTV